MDLTGQQRSVVGADGDFLLVACPGSGKTRAGAARVGALAADGKRVAICSYTNVGADRIAAVIGETRIVLGPEHFVGTLHGFLLRYVVYPFGGLVGAQQGPSIVSASSRSIAYMGDNRRRLDVDAFRMRPDGSLTLKVRPQYLATVPHAEIVAAVESEVRRHKREMLRAGYVSFDDAMFVALSILRRAPKLRRQSQGGSTRSCSTKPKTPQSFNLRVSMS